MFYALLILVAAVSRFLPHPPNMVCLGAIGLFAGCYVSGWKSYLLPLAVLGLSDVVGHIFSVPGIGFYNPVVMLFVYGGVLMSVPAGRLVAWIRNRTSQSRAGVLRFVASVCGGSVVASTLFFLSSNFGVWAAGWYPPTMEGLATCFVAAIPFFGYSLIGDLFFSCVVFEAYEASFSRATKPVADHTIAAATGSH